MAAEAEFYGPITIYVRKEKGEWAAYVDPFSVAGEGETAERAVESAIRNLTELLGALATEVRRHGSEDVEIICPLKAEDKRGASKTVQGLVWAASGPIRSRVPPAATSVTPISKTSARRMLATSASIGVVPPCAV